MLSVVKSEHRVLEKIGGKTIDSEPLLKCIIKNEILIFNIGARASLKLWHK